MGWRSHLGGWCPRLGNSGSATDSASFSQRLFQFDDVELLVEKVVETYCRRSEGVLKVKKNKVKQKKHIHPKSKQQRKTEAKQTQINETITLTINTASEVKS